MRKSDKPFKCVKNNIALLYYFLNPMEDGIEHAMSVLLDLYLPKIYVDISGNVSSKKLQQVKDSASGKTKQE